MPTYSLDVIHQMAREPDKIFLSRLAQRDSLNLGYGMTDIAACIGALQPSNFLNTQNYNGIILDAYRILYPGPLEGVLKAPFQAKRRNITLIMATSIKFSLV